MGKNVLILYCYTSCHLKNWNKQPPYISYKYVSGKVLDNHSMCVERYNLQEVKYIECTSGTVY